MAGNYNVDDILAEIERKRGGSYQPPAPKSAQPTKAAKPQGGATPFNLRGLNDEPAVQSSESPFAKGAVSQQNTRTDIPSVKAAKPAVSEKTQVMAAVRSDVDNDFEQSRKKKIDEFMKNSFAANNAEEELVSEQPEEVTDISQYFGGLKHSAKFNAEKAEKKPAKKKKSDKADKAASFSKSEKPAKVKGEKKGGLRPVKEEKGSVVKKSPKKKSEEDDDNEYMSPSDARDVRDEIFTTKKKLTTRTIVTGICAAVLLYLSLANLYPIPLLNAICPEVDMKIFLMVNLMVLVIAALSANMVIGNGLVSFFKFRADYDAPAALCTLAVITHSMALIFNSDNFHTGESGIYFFIAALSLFANSVGKRLMISRVEKNFAVASGKGELRGDYIISREELASQLAAGQGFAEPEVAYSAPIGFPEKFLGLSYSEEYTENLSRYLSHFFLVAAIVLAVVCRFFFDATTIEAFTAFCVVLCVASPLTPTLIGNLPLYRAAKSLSSEGAFISGYDAVEVFEEMNCVTVSANELYPKSSVELHGIKPLAESRIDEAILDAVSISCRINGVLSDALLGMVGGNRSILLPVDQVSYENNAGIRAMVNGKPVLMGRRSFMEKNEIPMPPPEYEKKFTKGGKKVLFIANSGAVTAMLIVSYRPSKKAMQWVNMLGRKEMGLIVYTMNPNITAKKISADYHYPDEYIKILPAELHDDYLALTAYRERGKAYIVSPAHGEARLHALSAVHSIKQSIVAGTFMQMAGLILGYALTAFLAFTGSIETLGFGQLAIYHAAWCVITLAISNLKKF